MTSATVRPRAAISGGIALPWAVPSAWGSGLILAGMGAAAFVAGDGTSAAAHLAGAIAVAFGLLALVWGGASLHAGRFVTPRLAIGAALAALAAVGILLATTAGRASIIGAAIAGVLLTATALLIVASRRRGGAAAATSVPVLPLLLAAAVIAVVVTPALGAVQDAALVRDDGTLVVVDPHQGH